MPVPSAMKAPLVNLLLQVLLHRNVLRDQHGPPMQQRAGMRSAVLLLWHPVEHPVALCCVGRAAYRPLDGAILSISSDAKVRIPRPPSAFEPSSAEQERAEGWFWPGSLAAAVPWLPTGREYAHPSNPSVEEEEENTLRRGLERPVRLYRDTGTGNSPSATRILYKAL